MKREPLPIRDWAIKPHDEHYVAIAAHTVGGRLYWAKVLYEELPEFIAERILFHLANNAGVPLLGPMDDSLNMNPGESYEIASYSPCRLLNTR